MEAAYQAQIGTDTREARRVGARWFAILDCRLVRDARQGWDGGFRARAQGRSPAALYSDLWLGCAGRRDRRGRHGDCRFHAGLAAGASYGKPRTSQITREVSW